MRERILNRGLTSGRSDDNEDVILLRFNTYKNQTWPIIENYGKQGGNVYEVASIRSANTLDRRDPGR